MAIVLFVLIILMFVLATILALLAAAILLVLAGVITAPGAAMLEFEADFTAGDAFAATGGRADRPGAAPPGGAGGFPRWRRSEWAGRGRTGKAGSAREGL